jgi:hypothetical protein
MIMISLLGMNSTTAFPIMMGSCAFLMPVCSLQFIARTGITCAPRSVSRCAARSPSSSRRYREVATATLSSMAGRVVVVYTASTMLRTATLERKGSVSGMGAAA